MDIPVSLSRRSMIGLLGGTSVTYGVMLADRGAAAQGAGPVSPSGRVPADLRPGGSFDRYLSELAAGDQFSGTVLLDHDGRTVLTRSFGMANRERSIPNQTDTIFGLASITKMFTGLAIAQLVQAGTIGYHQTVGSILDGFSSEVADQVTLHHLLTHTSGLGDYVQDPAYPDAAAGWASAADTLAGSLTLVRQETLQFSPGLRDSYSNSGFVVLTAVVEAASGQPYADFVGEHLAAAAGMGDTGFVTRPEWQADEQVAHPYALQDDGSRADTVDNQEFVGLGDGGLFATAPDLARFSRALFHDDRLLDPPFRDLATSGKVPRPPMPGSDAALQAPFQTYGMYTTIYNGCRTVAMSGGKGGPAIGGISTTIEMFPDLGWTVVVLGNYDYPNGQPPPIAGRARQIITGA